MARDLPRGWILPDAAILELAVARPQTREALARVAAVPPGTATRAADELLAAIAAAPPAERRARDERRRGASRPEQVQLQKVLQKRLGEIAAELVIQPEVLATRRELAALARGDRDVPALRGWRREVVGERLLAAMH